VHLAGLAAFMLSGLGTVSLLLTPMMFVIFPLFAVINRGGMLAFLAAVSFVALLRPFSAKLWRIGAIGVVLLMLFVASGIEVDIPKTERDLSFEQLAANFQSIAANDESQNLAGTENWREQWWDEIIDYTFYGDYFWTGKGYGVNLANEDGFQAVEDESLRSPHNGHLTILARSGVPGLCLWLLVQMSWFLGMLVEYHRSRLSGERRWASLFLFLLAYWIALMINFSFDVSLEGPMLGVWFWTIYGVGLAAMWVHKRHPKALIDHRQPSSRAQPLPAEARR
jgi:O-antigen ligase